MSAKGDIRFAKPREFVRQRVAEAAVSLSKKGEMAARVERANEALCHLVEVLYQADSDGVLANVDPVTYRLLIAAPWGRAGWRWWGLRQHEGVTLRQVLRSRQDGHQTGSRPLLFAYNEQGRYWNLSLDDYATAERGLWYLERTPVTLREWRGSLNTRSRSSREVVHRVAER